MQSTVLPDSAIVEIAMRCGRGWYRAEKPKPAICVEWQLERLGNYRRVIELAPRYVRDRDGMSQATRDAIWAHVCTETDLAWKARD